MRLKLFQLQSLDETDNLVGYFAIGSRHDKHKLILSACSDVALKSYLDCLIKPAFFLKPSTSTSLPSAITFLAPSSVAVESRVPPLGSSKYTPETSSSLHSSIGPALSEADYLQSSHNELKQTVRNMLRSIIWRSCTGLVSLWSNGYCV